jgi:hypothetical protein
MGLEKLPNDTSYWGKKMSKLTCFIKFTSDSCRGNKNFDTSKHEIPKHKRPTKS